MIQWHKLSAPITIANEKPSRIIRLSANKKNKNEETE
jgi:capsular polysaccharide biosynthesis protein